MTTYVKEIEGCVKLSSTCKTVTVDVWDTLLRRRCHPDAIKLHLCRYLLNNYWSFLPVSYRDNWKLLQARLQAEGILARQSKSCGYDEEYLYHEVYKRWLELIQFDFNATQEGFYEELSASLEKIELEQEHYVTYPDPHIKETLANYADCQVAFLSDFYFPAKHVQKLLEVHGFSDLVTFGVVSCDVKLNKRSGRLFEYFHSLYGSVPERHTHIGDNAWSDVESPRRLGIAALHYLPELQHEKRKLVEAGFENRPRFILKATEKLMECLSETALPDDRIKKEFYCLGRRFSLLFFSFILYVMEKAVADKVERLLFFTREGEFFLKLYCQLQENNPLGHHVPDASLLEVSRLSTFAGSLREFSCVELMRIWNLYSVQSMSGLFSSLDIDPEPFQKLIESYGLNLKESIRFPWQDQRILALFADNMFLQPVEKIILEKKQLLLSYLASAQLSGNNSKVGIVDIGWRGTIQDNLAYLFPNTVLHGYYLALNRFLNVQPENCVKSSFGPNLNVDGTSFDFLLDLVEPMEMLCNSPNGSVQGYFLNESGVQVTKLIDSSENRVHEDYISSFQKGVLESISFWADFSRTHGYSAIELKPIALDIWIKMIQKPHPYIAKALFELNHNELFGTGSFSDKSKLPDINAVLKALLSSKRNEFIQQFKSDVRWLSGFYANPNISYIYKILIRWFIRLNKAESYLYQIMH